MYTPLCFCACEWSVRSKSVIIISDNDIAEVRQVYKPANSRQRWRGRSARFQTSRVVLDSFLRFSRARTAFYFWIAYNFIVWAKMLRERQVRAPAALLLMPTRVFPDARDFLRPLPVLPAARFAENPCNLICSLVAEDLSKLDNHFKYVRDDCKSGTAVQNDQGIDIAFGCILSPANEIDLSLIFKVIRFLWRTTYVINFNYDIFNNKYDNVFLRILKWFIEIDLGALWKTSTSKLTLCIGEIF